jgi:protein-disulfide isomerase
MAQPRKTAPRGKNANVVTNAKSSKTGFYVIIVLVVVIGIALLSYLSQQSSKRRLITLDPNLPPVTSSGYVLGSPTAPVELVEFGDFECPGCSDFAQMVEPDIRQAYVNTGKVRFRFIDFPLNIHQNTLNASNAAACADEQGKFWEMHDLLFATQHLWNGEATSNPDKVIKDQAKQISGLDVSKLGECMDSRRMMAKVQAHQKLGNDRGVGSTPTFIYQNNQLEMPRSFGAFQHFLDSVLVVVKDTAKKPAAKK